MAHLVNRTFDEIKLADTASATRTLGGGDLRAWGTVVGNQDSLTAAGESQDAAGMVTAMMVALVGSALPGPGTSVRACSVRIEGPLPVGVEVTASVVVREKCEGRIVVLEGSCAGPAGRIVATTRLEVLAPETRLCREVPEHQLDGLIEACEALDPLATGVVWPCSADALGGAVAAAAADLIVPVLYGPEDQLRHIADAAHFDISGLRIVAADDPEEAAAKAAAAAGAGEVAALMKGSLHSDQFLHAAMQQSAKLRTSRTLSHCALMSVPTFARRFIVTDVALNIAPDLGQKRDICQNAIGFAHALGIETPKVAVLAAVEMVQVRMQATLDGGILAKMADRGQIAGGIVDGPLDLDAAVDAEAARIKGIVSPVAGVADVLLVPNIEAGNMVYKNLAFMADAQMAGLVVGARVPIILTSRADTVSARRFSAAVAVLYADAVARDPTILNPEVAE